MNWKEYNDTNLDEEDRLLDNKHKMLSMLDKIIIGLIVTVIVISWIVI